MESGFFHLPPVVDLVDDGYPILGPQALVYSSSPRLCHTSDGVAYVVKGPDVEVVAAEAIAHGLAGMVGLSVPKYAIGRSPDGTLRFASRHVDGIRDVRAMIAKHLAVLARVVAFDVWLFNDDRNMGGGAPRIFRTDC